MADIRIKDLATTAASTASDDFVAVDGSANGTRKLNAYSPTFGGNVTASGNLTVSGVTTSAGISNSGALTFTAAIGQVAGSIAKNATYGLTYYGVTGSSNDNTMLNASGAVVLSNPAGTTNATLTGNLTVSGTVAASGDLKLGVAQTSQFSANRFSIINSSTNNQKVSYELMVNDGTDNNRLAMFVDDNAHTLGFDTGTSNGNYNGLSFSIEGSPKLLIDRSGNVLIGTTVDSSALLQVGTNTTTAAGGMKFGTDTSLYRSAAGQLRGPSSFVDATFSSSGLFFGASMTLQANDNVLIKTNGSVTALTLDTSQNATFAGTILTATNAAKNAIVARYNSSNSLFGVTDLEPRVLRLVAQRLKEQTLQAHDHGLGEVAGPHGLVRARGRNDLQRCVAADKQAPPLNRIIAGAQASTAKVPAVRRIDDGADICDLGRPHKGVGELPQLDRPLVGQRQRLLGEGPRMAREEVADDALVVGRRDAGAGRVIIQRRDLLLANAMKGGLNDLNGGGEGRHWRRLREGGGGSTHGQRRTRRTEARRVQFSPTRRER